MGEGGDFRVNVVGEIADLVGVQVEELVPGGSEASCWFAELSDCLDDRLEGDFFCFRCPGVPEFPKSGAALAEEWVSEEVSAAA